MAVLVHEPRVPGMIEVIFFDAAGTLFHLPAGVGWHYRAVAKRHGCYIDEAELDRAFRAVWKGRPPRPASPLARPEDDREWWRAVVDLVLDRCSIAPTQMDRSAYFEELYAEFAQPGVWELFPEVPPTLAALCTHFRLGVISNFDTRLRTILTHLGIVDRFHDLIISSEVGAEKPDAAIFQHALRRFGVLPSSALHVGDDPTQDWLGATAAGLHVFRLKRPANCLSDLVHQLGDRSVS